MLVEDGGDGLSKKSIDDIPAEGGSKHVLVVRYDCDWEPRD